MANAIVTLETDFDLYPTVPIDVCVRPITDLNDGREVISQIDIAYEPHFSGGAQALYDRYLVGASGSVIAIADITTGGVTEIDVASLIPARAGHIVSRFKAKDGVVVALVNLTASTGLASHAVVRMDIDSAGALSSSTVYTMGAVSENEHLSTVGVSTDQRCIDFSHTTGAIFYSLNRGISPSYTVQVGITSVGTFTLYNSPFETGGSGPVMVSPDGAYAVVGRSNTVTDTDVLIINTTSMVSAAASTTIPPTSGIVDWNSASTRFCVATNAAPARVEVFNTAGSIVSTADVSAFGAPVAAMFQSDTVIAVAINATSEVRYYDVSGAASFVDSASTPVTIIAQGTDRFPYKALDDGAVFIPPYVINASYAAAQIVSPEDFVVFGSDGPGVAITYEFEPPAFWTRVEGAFA